MMYVRSSVVMCAFSTSTSTSPLPRPLLYAGSVGAVCICTYVFSRLLPPPPLPPPHFSFPACCLLQALLDAGYEPVFVQVLMGSQVDKHLFSECKIAQRTLE